MSIRGLNPANAWIAVCRRTLLSFRKAVDRRIARDFGRSTPSSNGEPACHLDGAQSIDVGRRSTKTALNSVTARNDSADGGARPGDGPAAAISTSAAQKADRHRGRHARQRRPGQGAELCLPAEEITAVSSAFGGL